MKLLSSCIFLLQLLAAAGEASGHTKCTDAANPNSGSHSGANSASAGVFSWSVLDETGSPTTQFRVNGSTVTYTLTLAGGNFKGFCAGVFSGSPTAFTNTLFGSLAGVTSTYTRAMSSGCASTGAVAQTSTFASSSKPSMAFKWTIPASGAPSTVTLWAVVVVSGSAGSYSVKKTLSLAVNPTPSGSPSSTSSPSMVAASVSSTVPASPSVTGTHALASGAITTSATASSSPVSTHSPSSTYVHSSSPSPSSSTSKSPSTSASKVATPSSSSSFGASPEGTKSPSSTSLSTAALTATNTATASQTFTNTGTQTETASGTGTASPSVSSTASNSAAASESVTAFPTPSPSASATASATSSSSPSADPSAPPPVFTIQDGYKPFVAPKSLTLGPIKMWWHFNTTTRHVDIVLWSALPAWYGIAFGSNTRMVGADSVTVIPDVTGASVYESLFTGKTMAEVRMTYCGFGKRLVADSCDVQFLDDASSYARFSWDTVRQEQTVESVRRLQTSTMPGTADPETSYVLTWAYGSSLTIGFHPLAASGAIGVDLQSGESWTVDPTILNAALVHGITTILGTLVLPLIGIAYARYSKASFPSKGPASRWFTKHWMWSAAATPLLLTGIAAGAFLANAQATLSSNAKGHIAIGVIACMAYLAVYIASIRAFRPAVVDEALELTRDQASVGKVTAHVKQLARSWGMSHAWFGGFAMCAAALSLLISLASVSNFRRMNQAHAFGIAVLVCMVVLFTGRDVVHRCRSKRSKWPVAGPTLVTVNAMQTVGSAEFR